MEDAPESTDSLEAALAATEAAAGRAQDAASNLTRVVTTALDERELFGLFGLAPPLRRTASGVDPGSSPGA